ncbi:MAG: bifunctional UDP-N-acetylglucosamine diphosphorylase/glucosamine-1-phosphate N-acetyltransferase GlmU [Micrococcales bacterium]|nr:bifunctional UDP-N-acetylglucosamine diphosphorylase/glucosamine-1-phosphate N-acetyltransferase GlmU [Micrococcales bacterium]NBT47835.1 bifunctional UDP-N-acetylglucosamine diphosphorylase/glucosamine-1-phosphate N-acetyltransferase GlmU [Actinomycetota bacterium]NBY44103.1 bifunctional UDP-N-acetylglucosamine diphosphorylase/glucosamine-1-phosphate N-acetyltransferase GlmU [Micrococcales bacterium]
MSEQHLAVVVLAAGEGIRMRSATPKVMHEIAGLPMLAHALATASSINAQYVIPVIRHEKEKLEQYIHTFYPKVHIAHQDEITGTGRALECGLNVLPEGFNGAVVVTSADVPLLDVQTIEAMLEVHLESGAGATLLTAVFEDPTGYGRIVRNSDGDFVSIVEHRDASEEQLGIHEVNAGVYVFDFDLVKSALGNIGTNNKAGEKYLTDALAEILKMGKPVKALAVRDNWLVAGVNNRIQLQQVSAELNRRICDGWMLAGVTIMDPSSTYIDVTVELGVDVTLLPGTLLKGITKIGSGSVIGPEVTIHDSTVGQNCTIKKSDINGSVIEAEATVGPFSYLRPGTHLGAGGKIGTFVETKNAKIGAGSKIPHLSYVGDATIGEQSNIGAGTIFANYDGVNKHHTTIGSHVRTGSHNVFVAPIEIADGAYTAAGTVVRKDVAAGDLAMNVAPQRNLAGWVLAKRAETSSAEAAKRAKE